MLTISQIQALLGAKILCGESQLDKQMVSACGSDLMSDVLAFVKDHTVLLTGLTNMHVVRAAEMLELPLIVFVRGKTPPPDVLQMAKDRGIALMCTNHMLYEACGILYKHGLPGGPGVQQNE